MQLMLHIAVPVHRPSFLQKNSHHLSDQRQNIHFLLRPEAQACTFVKTNEACKRFPFPEGALQCGTDPLFFQ